jgi:hypothetical protein
LRIFFSGLTGQPVKPVLKPVGLGDKVPDKNGAGESVTTVKKVRQYVNNVDNM